jgi:hypothetical protein
MSKGSQMGYKAPKEKVKVSQDTIDLIKAMGMKAALKKIGTSPSFKAGTDSAAAFKEGVRRMYGDARYMSALYNPKSSPGIASTPATRNKERLKNPANR